MLTCLLLSSSLFVLYAYNNGAPHGQHPAMGWNTWCSTWFCGSDLCSEKEVTDVAIAMLSNGMFDAGYKFINLDDCWAAETRDDEGNLRADPHRFPSGIKNLTSWLHSKGYWFGLYTSAGDHVCSTGRRLHKPPGSYGYYQNDANTFSQWEVDYVKIDWCGNDLYNATEQHTEFSDALNNTGRPIWLELCRGYSHPPPPYVSEVGNSWRVTGDHKDHWGNTLEAIEAVAAPGVTNMSGPYNWAYNDFLMTGGQGCPSINPDISSGHCPGIGMGDNEYRSEYSIWSITSSPLIVATDVRNMTDIMYQLLLNDEIISVNQQNVTPAGIRIGINYCINTNNTCQLWSRLLDDNSYAIVLFNSDNQIEAQKFNVPLSDINSQWNSNTVVSVRDLWAKSDIGQVTGQLAMSVNRHDSHFLKLAQV